MRQFKKIDGYAETPLMDGLLNRTYALPFLPVDDVVSGWLDIKQSLLNDFPTTSRFVQYFEKTWINGSYELPLWNCYQQTLDELPRSNNYSEGGNHAIQVVFGCAKPVIWKCLDKLKEFQVQTDLIIALNMAGRSNQTSRRKKWVQRETELRNIVSSYSTTDSDKSQYLRRLSFLFSTTKK